MTEADIASVAIQWLTKQGFDCYSEVPCHGGRADIVAVRQSVIWIVETKTALTADLCLQCRDRLREPCTGVLAVAGTSRGVKDNHPLVDWCHGHGIGVASVYDSRSGLSRLFSMVNLPKLRRLDCGKLLAKLKEPMKTNVAGTSGKYWTPFKDLIQQLQTSLKEGPMTELEPLRCFDDYRSRNHAANKRALTDYLERKLIPGWGVERRGNRLWIVKTAAK